jgi:hypothetical protein
LVPQPAALLPRLFLEQQQPAAAPSALLEPLRRRPAALLPRHHLAEVCSERHRRLVLVPVLQTLCSQLLPLTKRVAYEFFPICSSAANYYCISRQLRTARTARAHAVYCSLHCASTPLQ